MSLKLQTKLALTALLAVLLFGCRGSESSKTPIHLNPNMDLQEKYKAQEESKFFADGRTMRPIEEGVIPYGDQYQLSSPDPDFLKADKAFYEGLDASGKPVTTIPGFEKLGFKSEKEMLKRGQERYDIYCAPCHGTVGDAKGIVAQRGFPNVISLIDPKAPKSHGQVYRAILVGGPGKIMPSYAYQIKVQDRWAVTAYVELLAKTAQSPEYLKAAETLKEKK
ncbi:MAG: cytochrome c [Lentisphaeraceae bacterium]|nr:cytochrome c [Lentisphaeraceae bacterium]